MNPEQVKQLLARIKDPVKEKDIVSLGWLRSLKVENSRAYIELEMDPPQTPERKRLKEVVTAEIQKTFGIQAEVSVRMKVGAQNLENHNPAAGPDQEKKIKYMIAVASGKGGVGKSTVSVNLAVALAARGERVGLLDADVYGPSIPGILGMTQAPTQQDGLLIPPVRYGVKVISMKFFLPGGEAVVWRGPMLHKTMDQFIHAVDWGELDYLILDLPPGTGDVQLSLCQIIPLTGAVIVSTPQDLAFEVAERAIIMFQKLKTKVLGVIENMSGYICSHCGTPDDIFGADGAKNHCENQGYPFLGSIPLSKNIRLGSDEGQPIVLNPSASEAKAYFQIIEQLKKQIQEPEETGNKLLKIGLADDKAVFSWQGFGLAEIPVRDLRLECPCASCQDEMTGEKIIRENDVSQSVKIQKWEWVGHYAVKFYFSDGHTTGIYSFDYLHELTRSQSGKNTLC